jgi:hypothetical protein
MYVCHMTGRWTAANGMNLSKSKTNPNSRYSRIINYLRNHPMGEATKVELLENVFGRTIGHYPHGVSRGWGSYVWSLMVRNGDLVMTRKNRRVLYSLPK